MVRQGGPGDGEEDEEREDVHGVCVDDVGGQLTLPNMSIWFCMSFSDSVSKSVLPNYVYISPLSINCYRPISVQYWSRKIYKEYAGMLDVCKIESLRYSIHKKMFILLKRKRYVPTAFSNNSRVPRNVGIFSVQTKYSQFPQANGWATALLSTPTSHSYRPLRAADCVRFVWTISSTFSPISSHCEAFYHPESILLSQRNQSLKRLFRV